MHTPEPLNQNSPLLPPAPTDSPLLPPAPTGNLQDTLDYHGLLDNNVVDVPHIEGDDSAVDFGQFDPSMYGGFDDFNGDLRMYDLDFDGVELPMINVDD